MSTSLENRKRIVIKVGSALLVDQQAGMLSDWLASLASDIAALRKGGAQVLLVSSGAIALGRTVLGLPRKALKLDESQAAAAVGQIELARAWSEALGRHDLIASQILLTLHDTEGSAGRRSYLNARDTIGKLLALGSVPVINENDTIATSEIRYGDNDRLAARVATMVGADLLILLSDIDGLYTAPPQNDPDAKLIPVVSEITPDIEACAGSAGSELSRGGMVTKIEAGKIATRSGTDMVITSGKRLHPISALRDGKPATWFLASQNASGARKTWIAGQLEARGRLWIDAGAQSALLGGKSLLAAGVTRVEGTFERGDPVVILGPEGEALAQGLIAYDCDDAQRIAGHKSAEISSILGYEGRSAMVHRDNLVMTQEPQVAHAERH